MSLRGLVRGRRRLWIGFLGALAVALGLQLFQPGPPRASLPGDGTLTDHVDVPAHVDSLLRAACYDCHSAETRWPWYARVSPISWLVTGDVEHGRSNLDFSRWSTHPTREPTPVQRLRWMCRDMREDLMPPGPYLLMHPEARLTPTEEEAICEWSEREARRREGTPGGG